MSKYMYEDTRPIERVYLNDADGNAVSVGLDGVTRIECYPEKGEYDFIAFLKVWKGEHLLSRIPANKCTIVYQQLSTTEKETGHE